MEEAMRLVNCHAELGEARQLTSLPAARQAQHDNKNKNPRCITPGETTKN